MSVPEWVQDAIFYQIFPDRFANGDPSNDPPNAQPWGAAPSIWGFQGGDLCGITRHLEYLLDLGVNALYLNPIFQATSNHRYNTSDYYSIDPKLGTLQDFHELISAAHQNGMHVILDGAFNHCGRGFFAFNDVLENQEHSPYLGWFYINHFPVDAYLWGDARDYIGWWGMKSLPKFNIKNSKVRNYLLQVARYWIDQGADGWRLDVPNEIDDDSFWGEFCQIVKDANPEAYLLGEIWTADRRWVGEGHFDGLMNYPIRDAVLRLLFAGTLDIPHFAEKIEGLVSYYPSENLRAMYVLLGSHDTERLLTKLENDINKTRLAFLFQFAYFGAPAIYYGDEIGMTGGKDPDCRKAFPWDETKWNQELRQWVKTLGSLRKAHPALRRGDYQQLCMTPVEGCLSFARRFGADVIIVVMNASPETRTISIPLNSIGFEDGIHFKSLLHLQDFTVNQQSLQVTLSPWSGDWIQAD